MTVFSRWWRYTQLMRTRQYLNNIFKKTSKELYLIESHKTQKTVAPSCTELTESDWVWLSLTELQAVGHLTWITSDTAGHSELDQTFIFTSDHHNKKKNCSENNLLLYDQLLTDWKHFTFQLCDSLFCLILDWNLRADRKHPSDDRLCDVTSSLRQDELLIKTNPNIHRICWK